MTNTLKNKGEKLLAISYYSYITPIVVRYNFLIRQIMSLFVVAVITMSFSSCFFHERGGLGRGHHFGYRHSTGEGRHHREGGNHTERKHHERSQNNHEETHDRR